MAAAPRANLVLIYGGRSAEHEISCVSALHVAKAADPSRYSLTAIGITTEGEWVDATSALQGTEGRPALTSPDALPGPRRGPGARLARLEDGSGSPTVALPMVHGPMGEDGTLQGLLELTGIPYTGAGVAGSAVAMDKALAKSALAGAGIAQAAHISGPAGEALASVVSAVEKKLGWPVFVKPANMGSSIGISCAANAEELETSLAEAARYDEWLVIEERVRGRELEVGVLGYPDLRATLPGEVLPSRDFYDFEDKYRTDRAGLVVPADLPGDVAAEAGRLAVEACHALHVDCMARVDFFLEDPGRGLLLNEVNTIPGFTPISMYPRMWAAAGVPYPALIDELVDQALRRHARRAQFEVKP